MRLAMAATDWFRNTSWNPEIEANFFQKLGRARNKSQYLRIQAAYLQDSHPTVALDLLEQYFHLGDAFDMALAYDQQARTLTALGRTEEALLSYEAALERQRQHPLVGSNALLGYVGLIVEAKIDRMFDRALKLLDEHGNTWVFPVERYRANGARALLLDHFGRHKEAQVAATSAMTAAAETESGFQYHQDVGLVPASEDTFRIRVTALAK
jgi:tetratricopeptide (TPR) repeat protein